MKRTVLGVVLVAAVLVAGAVFVGMRAVGARSAEEPLDFASGELVYVPGAPRAPRPKWPSASSAS